MAPSGWVAWCACCRGGIFNLTPSPSPIKGKKRGGKPGAIFNRINNVWHYLQVVPPACNHSENIGICLGLFMWVITNRPFAHGEKG